MLLVSVTCFCTDVVTFHYIASYMRSSKFYTHKYLFIINDSRATQTDNAPLQDNVYCFDIIETDTSYEINFISKIHMWNMLRIAIIEIRKFKSEVNRHFMHGSLMIFWKVSLVFLCIFVNHILSGATTGINFLYFGGKERSFRAGAISAPQL